MSDTQDAHETSPRYIEVSRKHIFALVTAFVTSAGVIGVAYYNSRPDDQDRFYGWQGRANTAAIARLQTESRQLHASIEEFHKTKPVMMGRMATVEGWMKKHDAEYDVHILWGRKLVQEFALMDNTLNYKVDECLRRLP